MKNQGHPFIILSAGLMLFAASHAFAFDWQYPGENTTIYCNAPESGTVPRGRSYSVTFYSDGSKRAELQYGCTIRSNPSKPYKQEVSSTMACNYINSIAGSEHTLTGGGSSNSLFQSNEPSAICAHAYFDLGIRAEKK